MYYGYSFLVDQPVKRLYFAIGSVNSEQYWAALRDTAINDPADVANDIYRLMVGEFATMPTVVVSSDLQFDSRATAEQWLIQRINSEIEHSNNTGQSTQWLREHLINVDQIIRDITRLRNALTVNSGLYYGHDVSIISDEEWDAMARQLSKLQANYPAILPHVNFFDNRFVGFTDATGFHLPYREEPFVSTIARALEYHSKHKKA